MGLLFANPALGIEFIGIADKFFLQCDRLPIHYRKGQTAFDDGLCLQPCTRVPLCHPRMSVQAFMAQDVAAQKAMHQIGVAAIAMNALGIGVQDTYVMKHMLPLLALLLLWLGILISFQIVGFIMLIVKRKKFKLAVMPGEPARKAILHSMTHSLEMWIFFSFALLLFVYSYMPDILATVFRFSGI